MTGSAGDGHLAWVFPGGVARVGDSILDPLQFAIVHRIGPLEDLDREAAVRFDWVAAINRIP